jgi:hypothetical protein
LEDFVKYDFSPLGGVGSEVRIFSPRLNKAKEYQAITLSVVAFILLYTATKNAI